jgi:hypothetical protein
MEPHRRRGQVGSVGGLKFCVNNGELKDMRFRQTGITAIGFLLIAAMVGLLGFAGLKLTPVYLENMKIKQILKDVKSDLDGANPSPQSIRRAIDQRLNVEMVYDFDARDFEIEKSAAGFRVAANYEKRAPLLANVALMVTFQDEVEIKQ